MRRYILMELKPRLILGTPPKSFSYLLSHKKENLLKKHHYQEGLQLILEERFEEALSFLKPILNEKPILNARAI